MAILLIIGFAVVGGLAVQAADDPEPVPASYYGDIELNGEPAEPGVVIEAELDGDVAGSIEVTEAGEYGGPGIAESKLNVNGTASDEGEPVTFFVDGLDFDRTEVQETDPGEVLWESGDLMQVNLSADVEFEEPPTLESIELALDETELVAGDTTDATVTAIFDDGTEQDVTADATLESSDATVATVTDGTVTAESEGNATIDAEYEHEGTTESDSQTVTVEQAERTLEAVDIELATDEIEPSDTTTATVTATFDDSTETEVTDEASIESLDPDVATVSNGEVAAENPGTVIIEAGYTENEVTESDTTELTVEETEPVLESVNIDLDDTELAEGETTMATVTATYDDGTETDVTDAATIESLDPEVATVDGASITAESTGTATIEAEYTEDGTTESDTATLTVEEAEPVLESVNLELDKDEIEEGETTTVAVTATFDDGSETDVTDTATIESLNPEVATISNGEVIAESAGTAAIEAEYTENGVTESDTAEMTIQETEPSLESVSLDLDDEQLDADETTNVTVMASFDDGSETDVTDAATIESLDSDVATVSNGEVIAESPGTTTIEAEYTEENITESDTAALTVDESERVLESVTLELDDEALEAGATTTATVTATFEDGTEADVTEAATIESLDPGVATVSNGAVTAENTGTATIEAEYNENGLTESDTAELTVNETEPVLESVSLDLDDDDLEEGETTMATVTASFDDETKTDVTDVAAIESLDPEVATVSNGVITAESLGTATIEAEYTEDSTTESDTATLTVEETEPVLESVSIALDEDDLEEGETTVATVTATFDDGMETDVTDEAVIESLDPEVATVSNGEVTADAPGTAAIEAEYTEGEITASDTAELTIEESQPTFVSVSMTFADADLEEGETTDVIVTATFDDGSERDVTDEATIESLDTDVATVSTGDVTAAGPGSATIKIEYTADGVTETGTAELTVEQATDDIDDDADDDGPGFGIVAALFGLFAAVTVMFVRAWR